MSEKPCAREAILDAAETVVMAAGAAHLTLDAVAARAAVSKGGLLYHFPTKDTLVEGMIARCVQRFEANSQAAESPPSAGLGRDLRAYVAAFLEDARRAPQVNAALLAAGATNPKLLAPVRAYNRRLFGELAARKRGFERAAAVVLATHGLWLLETLQLSPLSARQRQRIVKELLALAEAAP